MDATERRDLQLVNDTMSYLCNEEGQDRTLVVECGQHMLSDILASGTLDPIENYVRRYCDVTDNDADVRRIADRIILNFSGA